jgi:hypothetical protein
VSLTETYIIIINNAPAAGSLYASVHFDSPLMDSGGITSARVVNVTHSVRGRGTDVFICGRGRCVCVLWFRRVCVTHIGDVAHHKDTHTHTHTWADRPDFSRHLLRTPSRAATQRVHSHVPNPPVPDHRLPGTGTGRMG